jgi:PilZ domain-containing protein
MHQADVERLIGRYVTVSPDASAEGDVYCLVEANHEALVLKAAGRRKQSPRAGTAVQCLSVAGRWQAVVKRVDGDVISLRLPDWAGRAAQRRHRRVPCEAAVQVQFGADRAAGRLMDISLGGTAMLLEPLDGLRPGVEVSIRLPSGDVPAQVTTVRAHAHPGLRVVGLAWRHLTPDAAAWVGRQVAQGAAALRRRPGDPDGTKDPT